MLAGSRPAWSVLHNAHLRLNSTSSQILKVAQSTPLVIRFASTCGKMVPIPKSMQGLQLAEGKPPTLRLTDLPIPKAPAGHVLIKIRASAIHPSDRMNAAGAWAKTTFPRVPGRDFAGVIAEGPREGEVVFGTGGFKYGFEADGFQAQYAVVPEDAVAPKPKELSWVQAATAGVPFSTADLMLEGAHAQAGETVLILGANGAVGSAAVILATHRGCKVLRAVRGLGGDVDTSGDASLEKVADLTNGKGVDMVLDTVGQLPLVNSAIARLAFGGRFVTVSAPRSGSRALEIDLLDLYRFDRSFIGRNSINETPTKVASRLKALTPALQSDVYQSRVDKSWQEVPLKDAVAAYEQPEQKKKYVIVME